MVSIYTEKIKSVYLPKLSAIAKNMKYLDGDKSLTKSNNLLRGTLPGDKLLTRDDEVLLKNYLYQSKTRTTLPPVVTHNLLNEPKSDIMNHLKRVKLFNHHSDKVKVSRHLLRVFWVRLSKLTWESAGGLKLIPFKTWWTLCNVGIFGLISLNLTVQS